MLRDLGTLLKFISAALMVPLLAAVYFAEWRAAAIFMGECILVWGIGTSLAAKFKTLPEARLHESMVTVALTWMIAALVGGLPFGFFGYSGIDSIFEGMSAWTTTGLSVVDVGTLPRSLLLWRSLMQWIGGLGIVVFALRGVFRTASSLYAAEARDEKLRPSLLGSARMMWSIYAGYTAAGAAGLMVAGMSGFEAINHAMTALATGGMSTRAGGIAEFASPGIELVLMALMMVGATPFLTHYTLWRRMVPRDPQLWSLVGLAVVGSVLTLTHLPARHAAFQVISALTGTGFNSLTVDSLPAVPLVWLVMLMVIGGSAGSTSGGLKLIRVLASIKSVWWHVRQLAQPHLVLVRKVGNVTLTNRELSAIVLFIVMYLVSLAAAALGLMLSGYSARNGLFLAASALGNVGLTTAEISGVPAKTLVVLAMWIGRLEFWAALVLIYNVISLKLLKFPHKL